MEYERRRTSDARIAAETLLSVSNSTGGSTTGINQGSIMRLSSSQNAFARDDQERRFCGTMSECRRTFCLLVTFDLIVTFVLWGVHIKVNGGDKWCDFIVTEVVRFNFKESLFDVVLCAIFRFLALLTGYALFRLRNPSVIAVTTFVTCVYIVFKTFYFNGEGQGVLPYVPLITSFIIVWIETWFLDFKVLPQEQSYREAWGESRTLQEREDERTQLLAEDELAFHTPRGGSPNLSHTASPCLQYGTFGTALVNEYRTLAEDSWRQVHRLFVVDEGWIFESSEKLSDSIDITIHSQNLAGLGKVLKLETCIEASPTRVFEETVMNCQNIASWNSTILEYRVLQVVDASTDIAYNVTAPAAKGVVGSRDFITLRHWKVSEGEVIMSSGCVVTHASMPPTRQHVRGENKLAGWEFRPNANQPNHCMLRMIVCTDVKGWIPQKLVDQALTGVLVEYIRSLHRHMTSHIVV